MLVEMAQRPFKAIPPTPSSCHPDSLQFHEVGKACEIDLLPVGYKGGPCRFGRSQRRDAVGETCVAAEELRRGVGHIEPIRQPCELALQPRKPIVMLSDLQSQQVAFKAAGQRPAISVKMKDSGKLALTREGICFVREED